MTAQAPEPYWCTSAPNVQRVWSSSSLSTLAECPRKYELSYVEGWTGKEENLDFEFGIAWHRLMESYWMGRFAGQDHEELLRELVPIALNWKLPTPSRPNQAGKTPMGLARSLVWYFEHYEHDEIEQIVNLNAGPAIEMKFNFFLDLMNPDGEPYQIQGYLDQMRYFNEIRCVWDYKTTSGSISDYYMARFDVDIQNHIYTLAARSLSDEDYTLFMADIIGVGVTYTDFSRHSVEVTRGELIEALNDITYWIREAERFAEHNYYPKNTKACNFCQFNGVCNKDPSVRIKFLYADFEGKRRKFVEERNSNADNEAVSGGENSKGPGAGE
jgi:hypothetical protein